MEPGRDELEDRVEHLLDRWEALRADGIEPDPADLSGDEPTAVRDEFARQVDDLRAADAALRGAGRAVGLPHPDQFVPLGVPGRYAIDPRRESHGRGGGGLVFEATDVELGRPVAYKILNPEHADIPDAVVQFEREARVTARLEHPGIVPVHGLVRDATDLPAYAMELVSGPTLATSIAGYRAIPIRRRAARREARAGLVRHLIAACRVVAYAHEKGVLHGDLKPLNILIDDQFGVTRVIDWGLTEAVQAAEDASGPGPDARPRAGTWIFMSPSQRSGDPPSVPGDIHALGVTLALVLADPTTRPGGPAGTSDTLRPARDTPRPLWAVAASASSPDRSVRPASASALADLIQDAIDDKPVPVYRDPAWTVGRRWVGRHPALTTLGVFSVVLLLGAVSAFSRFEVDRARVAFAAQREAKAREIASYRTAQTLVLHLESIVSRIKYMPAQAEDQELKLLVGLVEARDQNPDAIQHTVKLIRARLDHQADVRRRDQAWRDGQAANELRGILAQIDELTRDEIAFDPATNLYRAECHLMLGAMKLRRTLTTIEVFKLMSQRFTGMPIDPSEQANQEAALRSFDRALALLPTGPEDQPGTLNQRQACLSGRVTAFLFLGRMTEALEATDELARIDPNSNLVAMRGIFLQAAEMEQAKMPWSTPPTVNHARAIRLADFLVEQPGVGQPAIFNAACAFSLASGDPSAEAQERERRAVRAVALLRQIAAEGYFRLTRQRDELGNDATLEPLRSRDDFQTLARSVQRPNQEAR